MASKKKSAGNLQVSSPAVREPAARSEFREGENDTVPMEQRVPAIEGRLSKGPKKGERGEYMPASYKTSSGNVRTDR